MHKQLLTETSKKKLKQLRYKSGLFAASKKNVSTGYNKAWIRDNIYEILGFEKLKDYKTVLKTIHTLLDIFIKHESKITWAIKEKPRYTYQYIHARYNPETLEEFYEEWGNKQNDAIGAFLFMVGNLIEKNIEVLRNNKDRFILQKLVEYLESIEYWHDKDHGMWEENEEVHASSVGACVAGLKKISRYVYVNDELIAKGERTLRTLLPKESETKTTDLALLSLIYPYNVVTQKEKKLILKNIESNLVRDKGVLRYIGDKYYNENGEAQWTMGFPWLAIIYRNEKNYDKYKHYMRKTISVLNKKHELPELYLANGKANENTPLGWAQSMLIVAI